MSEWDDNSPIDEWDDITPITGGMDLTPVPPTFNQSASLLGGNLMGFALLAAALYFIAKDDHGYQETQEA